MGCGASSKKTSRYHVGEDGKFGIKPPASPRGERTSCQAPPPETARDEYVQQEPTVVIACASPRPEEDEERERETVSETQKAQKAQMIERLKLNSLRPPRPENGGQGSARGSRNPSQRSTLTVEQIRESRNPSKESRTPSKESSASRRQSSRPPSVSASPRPSEHNSKIQANLRKKHVIAHQGQCSKSDFGLFASIKDAYPFNDSKRKTVDKTEKINGRGAAKDWGRVAVSTLGRPKKLYCILCETFIVNDPGNEDFYSCRRCTAADRAVDLCTECYNSGAILVGEELAAFQLKQEAERRVQESKKVRSSITSSGSDGNRSSVSKLSPWPTEDSEALGCSEVSGLLHSGTWAGTYTEAAQRRTSTCIVDQAAHSRAEVRHLVFNDNGSIVGGCDAIGCGLVGHWSKELSQTNSGIASWTESHEWGTVEVKAKYKPKEIIGKFRTSDGGTGKVSLKPQR